MIPTFSSRIVRSLGPILGKIRDIQSSEHSVEVT
jgi:hypothetical protein